jgi:hypothetical protein
MWEFYRTLMQGEVGVAIVADDGEPCGALITSVLPTRRGNWLSLPFAGLLPSKGARVMLRAIQALEDIARKHGFTATRLHGSDPRFASLAKRRGYQQGYVEYVKEF